MLEDEKTAQVRIRKHLLKTVFSSHPRPLQHHYRQTGNNERTLTDREVSRDAESANSCQCRDAESDRPRSTHRPEVPQDGAIAGCYASGQIDGETPAARAARAGGGPAPDRRTERLAK